MVHHNLIYCLPIDCIIIKVHHNSRYCLLTNCILIKVHHTSRYCFLTDCILIKVHHNSRYYLPDDCVLLHITKILLTSSNCTGFLSKHECTHAQLHIPCFSETLHFWCFSKDTSSPPPPFHLASCPIQLLCQTLKFPIYLIRNRLCMVMNSVWMTIWLQGTPKAG